MDPTQEINALKGTVAGLQKTINDLTPFIQDASQIITVIHSNPQLRDQVRTAVAGGQNQNQNQNQQQNNQQQNQDQNNWKFDPETGQPIQRQQQQQQNNWKFDPQTGQPIGQQQNNQQQQNQNQNQNNNQPDPVVTDVAMKNRIDTIGRIEQRFGIDKLPADKQKEFRQRVEKRLNETFNTSIMTIPLTKMESVVADAYVLEDLPRAQEEGRIKGLIDARSNEMGALPTMQSAQPNQQQSTLTPEHRSWAKKFGVNEDRVAAHMQQLNEKGVISYQPKEQKQQPQQVPSGTPTVPPNQQPGQQNNPQPTS